MKTTPSSNEPNQGSQHQEPGTSKRGLASSDKDRQPDGAAERSRKAHASERAPKFDSDKTREAGSKGGQASHGGHSEKR